MTFNIQADLSQVFTKEMIQKKILDFNILHELIKLLINLIGSYAIISFSCLINKINQQSENDC